MISYSARDRDREGEEMKGKEAKMAKKRREEPGFFGSGELSMEWNGGVAGKHPMSTRAGDRSDGPPMDGGSGGKEKETRQRCKRCFTLIRRGRGVD